MILAHVSTREELDNPVYQAYQILHAAFTVAPILVGVHKFTNLLVDESQYLALARLSTIFVE